MSDMMALGLLVILTIASVYLAGRMAERRGRSFRNWGWVAAFIGPFALPLVLLFPNQHRKNGGQA